MQWSITRSKVWDWVVTFLTNTKGPFQGFVSFQRLGRLSAPTSEDVLCVRFPYAVFYSRAGGEIIITGVADLRMDPEKIQEVFLR